MNHFSCLLLGATFYADLTTEVLSGLTISGIVLENYSATIDGFHFCMGVCVAYFFKSLLFLEVTWQYKYAKTLQ